MNGERLLHERTSRNWEQNRTAAKLKVSQPYLSLLEAGKRPVTEKLARRAARVFDLPLTEALPLKRSFDLAGKKVGESLASQIAALGYLKFSHLKKTVKTSPAEVLTTALKVSDLDSRTVEALPWLVYNFPQTMNWAKIIRQAKLSDAQNRLGFLLSLARRAAEKTGDAKKKELFRELLSLLEDARLLREDAFNRHFLTEAEKVWLKKNRSDEARHWRVLSDLSADRLDF